MDSRQTLNLGAQGRLVVPAALRKSLGFEPGDKLIATEENGRLVLTKAVDKWAAIKAQAKRSGKGRSLATELIEQRRQEAKREHGST